MKRYLLPFILSISFAEDNSAFINAGRTATAPQSSLQTAQNFIEFGVQFMLT